MKTRALLAAASAAAFALSLAWPSSARADEEEATKPPHLDRPDDRYRYEDVYPFVTPAWVVTQLLPSPELAIGKDASSGETKTAFGLRWQLTPVLWSWGVNRRVSRWRFFVVDPLARMSGSLALEQTFEYVGGHVDKALARPGVKATFPLAQRGEYLAFSIGTSAYVYDSKPHIAHDIGLYTLWGLLGVQGTYAPDHDVMSTLITLRVRYF